MQKLPNIPDKETSKNLIYLFVAVAIIVLVIVFAKKIGSLFKATGQGLGIENSDEKQTVNDVFDSGKSPLFSYTFDDWQPKAPQGAPLLTVAQIHDLIEKLKSYRGIFFDDDEKAVGLFSGMKTQFTVAWFAKRFLIETGNDLFDWLRKDDTLFSQGFAAPTVYKIIEVVRAKPVFK